MIIIKAWKYRLENYGIFKDGQDYQEIETTALDKVREVLSDNEKPLQNALFSVATSID